MKRALISVYDKTNLEELSKGLIQAGFEIVSTGGTHSKLSQLGIPVTKVDDVTGFPEILGGRVKTLHPLVHGGILATQSEQDQADLRTHNIQPISLVVCNLYPFVETTNKAGVTPKEVIEQIDIGGVTLLRAAAKNFEFVTVVTDPADYPAVLQGLKDGFSHNQRQIFAYKAFDHCAVYDVAITAWFKQNININ